MIFNSSIFFSSECRIWCDVLNMMPSRGARRDLIARAISLDLSWRRCRHAMLASTPAGKLPGLARWREHVETESKREKASADPTFRAEFRRESMTLFSRGVHTEDRPGFGRIEIVVHSCCSRLLRVPRTFRKVLLDAFGERSVSRPQLKFPQAVDGVAADFTVDVKLSCLR